MRDPRSVAQGRLLTALPGGGWLQHFESVRGSQVSSRPFGPQLTELLRRPRTSNGTGLLRLLSREAVEQAVAVGQSQSYVSLLKCSAWNMRPARVLVASIDHRLLPLPMVWRRACPSPGPRDR